MIPLLKMSRINPEDIPVGKGHLFEDCRSELVTSYTNRIPHKKFEQRRIVLTVSMTETMPVMLVACIEDSRETLKQKLDEAVRLCLSRNGMSNDFDTELAEAAYLLAQHYQGAY